MSEENREVARKDRGEAGRVESLMKRFLSFARPPEPQPAEVDLNTLIASTLSLYGKDPRLAEDHAFPIDLRYQLGDPPAVLADPMQLEQVIINLFLNAVEAMPSGGTLTIRTTRDHANGKALIQIQDSGRGIPAEDRERIFEPFFTTKTKGTGLGLAISRQLALRNGGTLTVEDASTGGTVFTLTLPARRAPGIEEEAS